MLTHAAVVPYLLGRGLLTEEEVVGGHVTVEQAFRRNQNYRVLATPRTNLFLKHGAGDDGQSDTLAKEAAFYSTLMHYPQLKPVRDYCPALVAFDPSESLLILELIDKGESLESYCTRRHGVPRHLARTMGRVLASVHTLFHPLVTSGELSTRMSTGPLFILSITEPPLKFLEVTSAGGLELVRIIQQSDALCRLVERARAEWHHAHVIHGDVKWDNWLVERVDDGAPRLRLVDWELARLGDPFWDVGSVLCDFLCLWILSTPVASDTDALQVMKSTPFPIERLCAPMRAFWDAYVHHTKMPDGDQPEALEKAMRMAALRMLQTAFERVMQSAHVPGVVLYALQLSENIARDPMAAARTLFLEPAGDRQENRHGQL